MKVKVMSYSIAVNIVGWLLLLSKTGEKVADLPKAVVGRSTNAAYAQIHTYTHSNDSYS